MSNDKSWVGVPSPWRPCCKPPGQAVIWTMPGLRLALSSLLGLITGQALNSGWQQAPPLIWEVMNLMSPPIDGMASDKLSQGPPGEHCHSHTLHLTLQLLPFILLSGICLWNKKKNPFGFWCLDAFLLNVLYQLCVSLFFEAGLILCCVNERRTRSEASAFSAVLNGRSNCCYPHPSSLFFGCVRKNKAGTQTNNPAVVLQRWEPLSLAAHPQ